MYFKLPETIIGQSFLQRDENVQIQNPKNSLNKSVTS